MKYSTLALALFVLSACASLPYAPRNSLTGENGRIIVTLAPQEEITKSCTEANALFDRRAPAGRYYRGCVGFFPDKRIWILCPFNDAECLAHEIRHAVDGQFHEERK